MVADKDVAMRLLKTARGQIDGLMRMVEENRYCIDISHQLMATSAILGKLNREILGAHLHHCVKHSLQSGDGDEKLDEIEKVIGMLTRG